MKKHIQQALRRLRKAQDAIYDNKFGNNSRLSVETHNNSLVGHPYISVTLVGDANGEHKCNTVFIIDTYTPEKVEATLSEMAEFLRITI